MKPPRYIPADLYEEFTLGRQVVVEDKYIDESEESDDVDTRFNMDRFKRLVIDATGKKQNYYGNTDTWLYQALDEYPIKNKSVCIIGAQQPWYEAIAYTYSPKTITVSEYNTIPNYNSNVRYLHPNKIKQQFDICISISSFEHDGLGRYGDPINPNGDLEAMRKAKGYVKKNGLMFLAVPIGQDKLCWNAHRIYGKLRLQKLLNHWEVVTTFGFDYKMLGTYPHAIYQPIFVLKNT